jgi:alpha-glucuronidase
MIKKNQLKNTKCWRDACLLYFQTFSQRPFPANVEKPVHSLEHYKSLKFPFAPGIRPQWD